MEYSPYIYNSVPNRDSNAATRFLAEVHMGSNKDSSDNTINKFQNKEGVMGWDESESFV